MDGSALPTIDALPSCIAISKAPPRSGLSRSDFVHWHRRTARLGEFLRLQVKRNGLSLLPRARPFWPILRIDELAAKALAKLLGVRALREAKHVHVHAVAVEGMPARALRQILAEEVDGHEVPARAAVCGKHHLMRPVAVDCCFAELASPVDHARTPRRSPPALTQLTGRGDPSVRRAGGRRQRLVAN